MNPHEAENTEVGAAARKIAAKKWAMGYKGGAKGRIQKALAVVVLDPAIYSFLAEHDPMALRQAQQALSGTDYTQYLGQ